MVQELTPKILGEREAQQCRFKGGETKTLMAFLQSFLPKHAASVPKAEDMLSTGRAFDRHIASSGQLAIGSPRPGSSSSLSPSTRR